MFTRATAALVFLLSPLTARAQVPDRYPAHPVSFPGGVTGTPDIVYASYVGTRALTLDLYEPLPQPKPSPLILFLHGGSLKNGDARSALGIPDFPARLAAMTAHGYVVAAVNYRLRDEARFPAQVQDAKAAIAFLRAHAVTYHIDPARVVVWGNSSGGQLAALVAMTCGRKEFTPPSSGANACVQGVVSWYGDLQLSQEASDPDVAAFLGCAPCKPADIATADPMTFASSATPPMLIIHGTADTGVSITQSQAMAKKLADFKVPIETLYIPDVGHGFVGKTPQITRAANDQALARTLKFIDGLFGR
jgi:acetyl esterase/lipase